MSRNTSITLGEYYEKFINAQIESGRYASVSETVRAGLRILKHEEDKLFALQEALRRGEESGISDKTFEDIMREMDAEEAS